MKSLGPKLLAAFFVLSLLAGCGKKEAPDKAEPKKTDDAAPAETAAPPAEAPAETPAPPPADEALEATPTSDESAAAVEPEAPMVTDTAVPPAEPEKAADRFLDPDRKLYDGYVIKTSNGGEFVVDWYWKEAGRLTFQKAGGEIAIPWAEIASIEGRPKESDD